MFSLDTTFVTQKSYYTQKDLYAKGLGYSFGIVVFLELLRSQVCEMRVLQLIPGFYLVLLLTSFLVLVNLSNLLLSLAFQADIRKAGGAKTLNRMYIKALVKLGFLILFTGIFLALNSVIPLGFDAFDSYGETTLENVWSFAEIISIETTLIFFVVGLSQVPVFALINLSTEEDLLLLPEYWKPISLVCFILAGVITPTVDADTQLNFAAAAIGLYIMLITIIQRIGDLKFVETATLS